MVQEHGIGHRPVQGTEFSEFIELAGRELLETGAKGLAPGMQGLAEMALGGGSVTPPALMENSSRSGGTTSSVDAVGRWVKPGARLGEASAPGSDPEEVWARAGTPASIRPTSTHPAAAATFWGQKRSPMHTLRSTSGWPR